MSDLTQLRKILSNYAQAISAIENYILIYVPEDNTEYLFYNNPVYFGDIPTLIVNYLKEGGDLCNITTLLKRTPIDPESVHLRLAPRSCNNFYEFLPFYLTSHYFDDGSCPVAKECAKLLGIELPEVV